MENKRGNTTYNQLRKDDIVYAVPFRVAKTGVFALFITTIGRSQDKEFSSAKVWKMGTSPFRLSGNMEKPLYMDSLGNINRLSKFDV